TWAPPRQRLAPPDSGCDDRNPQAPVCGPVRPAARCPLPVRYPDRAAPARSLRLRSYAHAHRGYCIFRRFSGSPLHSALWNAAGAMLQIRNGASRGTRRLPEVIHVKVRCLVDADRMQLPAAGFKRRLQPTPDVPCNVFRGWHLAIERRHFVIEKTMVIRLDDFAVQNLLQ